MDILVVDDNTNSLRSLCMVLKDLGHTPKGLQNPTDALLEAKSGLWPLIITDIRMPGMDGLSLLSAIKSDEAATKSDVVLITGHGDMATAVEALRRGAYDYLNKPINARELAAVVERCAERQSLVRENAMLRSHVDVVVQEATAEIRENLESVRKRLREVAGVGVVIAESPAMRRLMREALILHSDPTVPVLIEGETGTGKEIFARYIHYGETGGDALFMDINCAAIPHELFESELFGHEPGAYTGSRAEGAPGKLEQAGTGTVFLDEVAEMPLSLQPKLLRVLEERTFYRVGGVKKRRFEARVVCAGNRNMDEMVERGLFRRDLYHRLRVGHICIPPLRERQEDIRPLAEHFLQREAGRKKRRFTGIDSTAMRLLEQYAWPGNVRELENALERAVLMNDDEQLLPAHLEFLGRTSSGQAATWAPAPNSGRRASDAAAWAAGANAGTSAGAQAGAFSAPAGGGNPSGVSAAGLDLRDLSRLTLPEGPLNLEELMDAVVLATLERFAGNKSKAADHLGISRFALHRRLQQKGK